jgi:hypothetical protein
MAGRIPAVLKGFLSLQVLQVESQDSRLIVVFPGWSGLFRQTPSPHSRFATKAGSRVMIPL